MQHTFLRQGNLFLVLNYLVCCESHLRLIMYRINKKIYLLKVFNKDSATNIDLSAIEDLVRSAIKTQ